MPNNQADQIENESKTSNLSFFDEQRKKFHDEYNRLWRKTKLPTVAGGCIMFYALLLGSGVTSPVFAFGFGALASGGTRAMEAENYWESNYRPGFGHSP